MNRLARGVSSISSKCSSSGASFPFCVSVLYFHAIYNSLFTQLAHPAHLSLQEKNCHGAQAMLQCWSNMHRVVHKKRKAVRAKLPDDVRITSWYENLYRWRWIFSIYMQKQCMLCLMGKNTTTRAASKSSRGASRALHCLLVYMMLRH